MATKKNSGKATKPRKKAATKKVAVVRGRPFPKGESGNPNGRPLGKRNRRTVLWAAIERIAEKKKMTPEEIEDAIQATGIEKAFKGSFLHYAEVSNGLYGKIQDKVDVTSDGKSLADIVAAANHARSNKGNSK